MTSGEPFANAMDAPSDASQTADNCSYNTELEKMLNQRLS